MSLPTDSTLTVFRHRRMHGSSQPRRSARPDVLASPFQALGPQLRILAVAGLALATTVVLQALSFTVPSVSGHATVETATGLIGVLVTFVFVERLRSSPRLRDFLIALSLGILSATDLILGAGPTLLSVSPGNAWDWIVLANRLLASAILVWAAFCPELRIDSSRRLRETILTAAVGVLIAAAVGMLLWRSQLPSLLGGSTASESSGYGAPLDHPLSYLQLASTVLAVLAAVGLARHAAREDDRLEQAVAAGVAVLAIARFNYFLVPSLNSGALYAGDILKLGAYLLVLYGCIAEFRALQSKLIRQVAMDERRRMARDMHDGLAQELAFIASHSQRLDRSGEDGATVVHLQAAAERALHDSRTTIAVLTSTEEEPLDVLIERTVETLRMRFAVELDLDLDPDVIVDAERRNALLRILHEASINAIRHGKAKRILVHMRGAPDSPCLRITDDGAGFDVRAALSAGSGLGLISMQERAEMLGGTLTIASRPGAGAIVEVELP